MDEEEHELGGAWGVGAFENPRALKWLAALVAEGDPDQVRATLRQVIDSSESPAEELCMDALAAAEIVASALGRTRGDVPDEARAWAKQHGDGWTSADVKLAVKAVKRIASDSELKEFWDEVDDVDEWLGDTNELASRLAKLHDAH